MVHKKYIKRGGKTYGPYLYESYRENGRVKKKYIGMGSDSAFSQLSSVFSSTNKSFTLQMLIIFILVVAITSVGYYTIHGKSVSELPDAASSIAEAAQNNGQGNAASTDSGNQNNDNNNDPEEKTNSNNGKDSNPESASNSQNSHSSQNSESSQDNEQNEQSTITSGLAQENEEDQTTQSENSNIIEEETDNDQNSETDSNETIEEEQISENNGTINEANGSEASESNQSSSENSSIDSNDTISDDTNQTLNETEDNETVTVDANESFVEENETVTSPIYNETNETPSEINISLTSDIPILRIAKNGSAILDFDDYFEGAESYSTDEIPNIDVEIMGSVATFIPESDFSGARTVTVNAHNDSETLQSSFTILVSSGAISIKTVREQIKVGEPVKWIKNITVDETQAVSLELPGEATNIVVTQINDSVAEEIDTTITGNSILVQDDGNPWLIDFLQGLLNKLSLGVLTGNVVSEETNTSTPIALTLDNNATQYLVEYTTPGPEIVEMETERGKQVSISAPESLNYTDAIASTTLPENFAIRNVSVIKIIWHNYDSEAISAAESQDREKLTLLQAQLKNVSEVPESRIVEEIVIDGNESVTIVSNITEETGNVENITIIPSVHVDSNGSKYIIQEVAFDAYDLSGEGILDYVEWVVPHFSEQYYEIILVTNAEHLDEDREFIEDVYSQIKEIDGVTAIIPEGHYLRVTFERNLTNEKDITIYANSSSDATVSVYEKDGNTELATFTNITGFEKRQILLQNLSDGAQQNTFDLLVQGGDVEFDHVIDPELVSQFDQNLLILYHFNNDSAYGENDTFVYDFAGANNNGTRVGGYGPLHVDGRVVSSGKIGGGLYFNATSVAYINAGNGNNITENQTQLTIAGWLNTTCCNTRTALGSQSGVFDVRRSPSNEWQFSLTNESGQTVFITADDSVTYDIWYHLAAVYNGTATMLYVNGVLENQIGAISGPTASTTNNIQIGRETSFASVFNGTIDEFAIWNRSLSANEVLALYHQGNNQALVWTCNSVVIANFTNQTCWNLGRVPMAGDDVIFNGSGIGNVNITNNTLVQNLNSFTVAQSYNGTIHFNPMFANGSWGSNAVGSQAWNVTKNITILNGTMKIYGDYLLQPVGAFNITPEGHGQIWRAGNITIGPYAKIDGAALGFTDYCCGGSNGVGGGGAASHGGGGGPSDENTIDLYGNASAPTSLGSGGSSTPNVNRGGSAIKLQADSGTIIMDGIINMSSVTSSTDTGGGSGGSVWLYANNITGRGVIVAEGSSQTSFSADGGGGGGRVKFDYNYLNYTGRVSVAGGKGTIGVYASGTGSDENSHDGKAGTFSFSTPLGIDNHVYPSSWILNGSVGLEAGNYTILGNLVVPANTVLSLGPRINYTANIVRAPVFLNVTGNVTILGRIDGYRGGYLTGIGPGADTTPIGTTAGSSHGGRGGKGNGGSVYGDEIYPVSVGSGSGSTSSSSGVFGGAAFKLLSNGSIEVNGTISMNGNNATSRGGSAGGSILLIASTEIKGNGTLTARALSTGVNLGGGGGGRIALHARDIDFRGNIDASGGISQTAEYSGSGGTIYVNVTDSVRLLGNVSVVGYNGSTNYENGQRINITDTRLTLLGNFNASLFSSSTGTQGNITLNQSYCPWTILSGQFSPGYIYRAVDGNCIRPGVNFTSQTSANGSIQASDDILVNVTSSDNSGTHYTFTDFDNSLLLWMRMDMLNLSLNGVEDYSTYRNNGTLAGNAYQNVSGRFGGAMTFDGSGDYVRLSSNPITNFSASNSICLWMYTASPSVTQRALNLYTDDNNYVNLGVVGNGDGFFVGYESGGTAYGRSRQVALSSNTWTHGCYVFNGTGIALYVDGSLVTSTVGNGLSAASGNVIGNRGTAGTFFWNGSIDEVFVFNRTLSQAEINSLYNASATQYYNTFSNVERRANYYSIQSHSVDAFGNANSTEIRYLSIPATTELDAYTWADRAGWFVQSQNATAVSNRTYIFGNFTATTDDTSLSGALCNVTFTGGAESSSNVITMDYNNTALLYYHNRTFQYAGNYSWSILCALTNYEMASDSGLWNVSIPIRNTSALGYTTQLATVNHNENVNLTVEIPSSGVNNASVGYNLSAVWANITRPDGIVTRVFLSGNRAGGIWNGTYTASGVLGNYSVQYYANLTNGYSVFENMTNSFIVKNTSISILVQNRANTTQTIPISGQIRLLNGTAPENLANNLFVISLNGVTVSSDTYSDSDFVSGSGRDTNLSNIVQLNLSGNSGTMVYSDDFSTQKYQTDSVNYNSIGYASGEIFSLDAMTSSIGNITYRFTSPTAFYNASVRVVTQTGLFDGGGNTSVHYSIDNITWFTLNSSILQGANITGSVPVNGRNTFYIMLASNTNNFNNQNPIVFYNVNYSQYQYASSGNFVSEAIYLPNVTYTTLKWSQNVSGGQIAIQLRESDDGISWGAWSTNYTNNLVNSITGFTKDYLQYNATLTTTNTNMTPVLNRVNISYFNATTNSTGGYNYSITIPTDNLGVLPLQVSVVQSPEGIVGLNTTNITIWAETSTPYYVVRNYSNVNANYSVYVNFTRIDTGDLVNGTINVTITHSGGSVSSRQCFGSQCIASWLVPSNTGYGNYTINITAHNESAYYLNASANFSDFLEQRNTTATLRALNRTIEDFTAGQDYEFYWNFTLNNTGNASMLNSIVYNATKPSIIRNFTFLPGCTRIYPGTSCNVTAFIIVSGGTQAGEYLIPFRANWSDNDGSVAGGNSFISYTEMYIIITLDASMSLSNNSVNTTIEHGHNSSFNFTMFSTGTDTLINVEPTFIELNRTTNMVLNSSWVEIDPSSFAAIPAGSNRNATVTITVPLQTSPGNYSGVINVTGNGGSEEIDLIVIVPLNGSWYLVPASNFTYNRSFSLGSGGEIGNFTLVNTGNINMTFNVSYNPTSGAETDYSLFGSNLFAPNFVAGSVLTNPTGVNVTKGGNTTITLWQRGNSEPLPDVGVTVKFYNISGNPQNYFMKETFEIAEQAPTAGTIWFSLDNFATNTTVGEQNKNITLKVYATDDVDLNATATVFNVTWATGSSLVNATVIDGQSIFSGLRRVQANYSANFMPLTAGQYSVFATIFDVAGDFVVSDVFNFTSVGSTTVTLRQNVSSVNVSTVDLTRQGIFYINYTVNNTGSVYAYSPTLAFSGNSTVLVDGYAFSDLPGSTLTTVSIRMNVSVLTYPGQYNITATLTWRNPNNIVSTDDEVISVNVLQNKSLRVHPSTVSMGSIAHGTSNSTVVNLNNTGNIELSSISLSCYTGSLCSNFSVSFNASSFTINANTTRFVNISLSAPLGLASGSYSGFVNVSEQNISTTFEIQATVPSSLSWNTSTRFIQGTAQASATGVLASININNTGNSELSFLLGSSNTSLIMPNMSSITVPAISLGVFNVNYTTPETEGIYSEIIFINESTLSASPQRINVSINLTVTKLTTSFISPTNTTPETDVLAGDLIPIYANLTYVLEIVENSTEWEASVGGADCDNVSSTFLTGLGYWNISCYAPDIADGQTYNVTITANHTSYGVFTTTQDDAVVYRDLSPPYFNITRNNVNKNSNISLLANVSDNVEVDSVSVSITYPNLTTANYSLTNNSNGLYALTSFVLDLAGEYSVNYTAIDTTGNQNSTTDWFEVYDLYTWSGRMLDSANSAVSDVNITLFRPNTTFILLSNNTNANGLFSFNINRRFYDIKSTLSGDSVNVLHANLSNVTVSNITLNMHKYSGELLNEIVPSHKPFIGIVNNATGFDGNSVQAIFNYSGYSYDVASQLKIVQCSSWNYTEKVCGGSWTALSSSVNLNTKLVTGNGSGFTNSAFFLAENKCGNGACEAIYDESSSTCSLDCQASSSSTTTTTSSGGGGGGGGLSSKDLNKIAEIIRGSINLNGVRVDTTSIYREMFAGDTSTVSIKVVNTLNAVSDIGLSSDGEVQGFISYPSSVLTLESGEARDVLVRLAVPKFTEVGDYVGNIVITSGDREGTIPVTIKVLSPEGKLLDVKIQPLQSRVAPGDVLRLQLDLLNLGQTKRVDIQFELQLVDVETGEIYGRQEEAFAVETSTSTIKNMTIPENIPLGNYLVKGTAYYASLEANNQTATSIAEIEIDYPLWRKRFLFVPMWIWFLAGSAIGLGIGAFAYIRYLENKQKRFKSKVEFNKLPQPGPNAAFVGKIAETGIRAFTDLNKLQMHTLVAGSTGGGKTVAAQAIVEAALLHNKSVIVFDPTAQWTGFFRKCEEKNMLTRYGFFDMKTGEARAFNGVIKTIRDPYEFIDIKKYIDRPGEITVFNVSNLTPAQIDILVASTIEQIFNSHPEESADLKTLIVYDEVHRLLPKFGGTGQGFIQIERGAREFRKWGIGLVLISQVLSDFVGEIKANIGTEIQLGTRYEGDLERVNVKYGEDVLKSVVKEPIGTGMVVNAEYNAGRPYFVAFRPLLHSTKRLSKTDLDKYEKYYDQIEDIEYQIDELKKLNADVFDVALELKLAREKVKEGQFQIADMYLESLAPSMEAAWKKVGKKPVHIAKLKLTKEQVAEGLNKAAEERAKYIKKNPQEESSFEESLSEIGKIIKDKKGKKDTSKIEVKFNDFSTRVKSFKGKLSDKDKADIQKEMDNIKKEAQDL